MKKLTIFGIVLTVIWILIFAIIIVEDLEGTQKMSLNEWGDFLGGFTAPLALLWLIIGYFQQGEELRLNTGALRAQQEELQRQSAATEQLVFISKRESERAALKEFAEAQPIFIQIGVKKRNGNLDIRLKNVGGTVSDLSIETAEPVLISISPMDVFVSHQEGKLNLQKVTNYPVQMKIKYRDKFNNQMENSYELTDQLQLKLII